MKNIFTVMRARGAKAFVAASVLLTASSVHAAGLPPWATAMFTDIEESVDATLLAVMPIAATVIIAFVVLKVSRRGANKI